jgi:hypothetical protein
MADKFGETYIQGREDGYHHAKHSHQAGIAHALGELFNPCHQTPPDPQLREIYDQGFKDGEKAFWDELRRNK